MRATTHSVKKKCLPSNTRLEDPIRNKIMFFASRHHLHSEAEAALSMFALLSVNVATICSSSGRGASSPTTMPDRMKRERVCSMSRSQLT